MAPDDERDDSVQHYEEDIRNGNGNWTTWSKYVLKELSRLGRCAETSGNKLDKLNILVTKEISAIKTKVALISAGVAFGLSIFAQLIFFLLTKGRVK